MLDQLSSSYSSKLPHSSFNPKLKAAVSEVSQVSVVQEDTQRENAVLMKTDHVDIEDRCQNQFKTAALDAIVQPSSNAHQQPSCKQQTKTNQLNTEAIKLQKSSSDLLDPVSVNDSTKLPTSGSEVKPGAKKVTMVASSEEFTTLKAEMQQAIKFEIESRCQTEFEKIFHLDEKIQKNENNSSQDLVTLQNRFHQKEREIATLSNKLSESESQTAIISQNLTELTQQCKEESEAKNQQLRAMNQALTVANQEIVELKKSLQVKEDELTAINQEIGVLRESVQIKDRELRERLQTKEDEIATLRESFQQRETGSAGEIATLTERLQAQETQIQTQQTQLQAQLQAQETQLQAQETQLQTQEAQQHTQVAQLQGQLQTQATQMQTFCNNALQQMRQQIERDVQRRMERLTNQMTTMQTVFNAVKPQWLVARHEITLSQNILGNGGWGRVVQATFRGEQVAAKCLHHQIISEYNIRHFVREMQISAKCHHPNLLKFLCATLEGDPIILTELMQTNLHDVIRQCELKDHQFVLLLQDIASAINYLHCLSPEPIIHRDISSSNVLLKGPVGSKWIAKLSDFGSANFLWHTSDQSRAPGNPTYAAPEVLSPHSHSEKMDVYSFGVLVYEMCSGQSPSLQVRNEVLPSAAAVWPEPQRHYVSMIVSCTRENKDDRPTMSEVLVKL
ncbi:uncharacterized protein [Dysidea avara]|uniref:uncharacterized protein n=1 Tax=Dysidea avara TaxID=196820 RepID=UPI0033276ECA